MKVIRRGRRARGPETEVTRVVEEGQTPPEGPPIGPWMDRDLWPWMFLLLALVVGGIVAAVLLTRDDKKAQPRSTVVATSPPPTATVTVKRVTTTAPATTTAPPPAAGRVNVANVLGIAASTAVERLRDQGLNPVVRSVFSPKPRGVVAAQTPGAGTQLAKGSTVTLNVSKGQPAKAVPDVVGQTESQAVSLLKAAGFDPDIQRVPSQEAAGTVVAQKPRAGEKQPGGTHVLLNVSAGPKSSPATTAPARTTAPAATTPATTQRSTQPATTAQPAAATVPDVQGKTLQQAVVAMRQAGLLVEVRYVPSEEPLGTVVAQAKSPGTSAKRGDHVLVTVSQGNDPNAAIVTLPSLEGQAESAATSRLRSAGLVPIVGCLAPASPAQVGKVVDEQPGGGTQAPKGAQVLIYIGRASCG